jgi:hypothetical protein
MSADIHIDCYTSFYMERDQLAICGVVFVVDDDKKPFFKLKREGDYLNGLFELLIERIRGIHARLVERTCHLNVHIHHSNRNFRMALDKSIKSANAARGYKGDVLDNIIKHTLTRKDYHKPVSYKKMTELAKLLVEINEPTYCLTLTTCGDSRSSDQLAAYTACQGFWEQVVNTPPVPTGDAQPAEAPIAAAAN